MKKALIFILRWIASQDHIQTDQVNDLIAEVKKEAKEEKKKDQIPPPPPPPGL